MTAKKQRRWGRDKDSEIRGVVKKFTPFTGDAEELNKPLPEMLTYTDNPKYYSKKDEELNRKMIKNIDKIKSQLGEVASANNAYKYSKKHESITREYEHTRFKNLSINMGSSAQEILDLIDYLEAQILQGDKVMANREDAPARKADAMWNTGAPATTGLYTGPEDAEQGAPFDEPFDIQDTPDDDD